MKKEYNLCTKYHEKYLFSAVEIKILGHLLGTMIFRNSSFGDDLEYFSFSHKNVHIL